MRKRPSEGKPTGRPGAIHQHYAPRISANLENYDVVDWASPQSQEKRFGVLADNVDLDGRSLLDVGCGLGDLWDYLRRRRVRVAYTGVDLLEPMADAARQRHPDQRFLPANIFAENVFRPESFDVVFCSGIFSLDLGNNREFLAAALPRLLDLARECVVINLLHQRAAHGPRDAYFHFDPKEVLAMARPFPCEVRILDEYLPNDFTVICRKRRGG